MNLKVNYNIKCISSKDIALPFNIIKSGEVFNLKDAYKENGAIVLGIAVNNSVHEALFRIPNGIKIKNKAQLKNMIESFIFPYHENFSYTVVGVNK